MPVSRNAGHFFAAPHAATFLLLTVNIAVFGLCLYQAGMSQLSSPLLFRDGAMYSLALQRQEYWRLVAYGFLHANPIHLLGNMLCLALWGGHLERRLGWTYFVVVYFSAMVFGAIAGDFIHPQPYLTVGASGATSGILGALFCLWILGKIDVTASFFIANIGLNVALTLGDRNVNWSIHFGGFAAGLITCAVLDVIEKTLGRLLRCKFPEFVKANLLVLAAVIGGLLWSNGPVPGPQILAPAAIVGVAGLAIIKLADVVLAQKRGIAIMVLALATANAATIIAGSILLRALVFSGCAVHRPTASGPVEVMVDTSCANPELIAVGAAILAFVLTVLLQAHEIRRGLADVGFVAASLQAARNRSQGI
jgi:rhomboid protease GluP